MDLTSNKQLAATTQADQLFHLGVNQYFAVNFLEAIKNLKGASVYFLQGKQYAKYLKSQTILIAIYTEMENFSAIDKINNSLSKIIHHHKETRIYHPRFYHYLGLCSIRKADYSKAQTQLSNALSIALKLQKEAQESNDQKKLLSLNIDICYISYGFVWVYIVNNQISEAIQELKNMKQSIEQLKQMNKKHNSNGHLSTINLEDLISSPLEEEIQSLELLRTISEADILSIQKKYTAAEQLYWLCYEKSQHSNRKRHLSPHLLLFLGKTYMKKGDYEQAAIFLKLAQKSANPDIFKRTSRRITESIATLKTKTVNNYDIIVSFENKKDILMLRINSSYWIC